MDKKTVGVIAIIALVVIVAITFFTASRIKVSFSSANDLTGLPIAIGCTDSDGGVYPNVRGTTTGRVTATTLSTASTDSCTSTTQVREWYCNAQGYKANQIIACQIGQTCTVGACVGSATNTTTNTTSTGLPDLIGSSKATLSLSGTVNVIAGNVQSSNSPLTATYECVLANQGTAPAVGSSYSQCSFSYGTAGGQFIWLPAVLSNLNLGVGTSFTFRQGTTTVYVNGGPINQLLQNIFDTGSSSFITNYNIDLGGPPQRITESNEANNQQGFTGTIDVGGLVFNNLTSPLAKFSE